MSTDPSKDIPTAIKKIREQMDVNLSYFKHIRNDQITLDILQSHIEEQLKEIERHLKNEKN